MENKPMKNQKAVNRQNESGNVLFLILIAVALFAALSYAVTQSSRSGGGDANNETNLVNSASVTQYPASVRTSMIRMQVSKGIQPNEMEFNSPANFENCQTVGGTLGVNCVFHPAGGGATFVPGPADIMVSGNQTDWVINSENQIDLIGTSNPGDADPTTATADIIAFLPGIREGVCQSINNELGITGIPTETGIDFATIMENEDGSSPPGIGAEGGTIGNATADTDEELDGHAFGCFEHGADNFVYYHVLIEQ